MIQLRDSEHSKYHTTLELFAYGRYKDYEGNPDKYIELSDSQKRKLRQLTVVSLSAELKKVPYDAMLTALGLDTLRQLEEIIIDCINAGLVTAKIDQRNKLLLVTDFMARDVRQEDLSDILNKLGHWRDQCDQVMQALESSSAIIQEQVRHNADVQQATQASAESMKQSLQANSGLMIDDRDNYSKMRRGNTER